MFRGPRRPNQLGEEMNRIEAIKAGIKRRKLKGLNVGRPLEFDRSEMRRLRGEGLTIMKIAEVMKCSHYPVQLALKGK